jgi:hypothetical protein
MYIIGPKGSKLTSIETAKELIGDLRINDKLEYDRGKVDLKQFSGIYVYICENNYLFIF